MPDYIYKGHRYSLPSSCVKDGDVEVGQVVAISTGYTGKLRDKAKCQGECKALGYFKAQSERKRNPNMKRLSRQAELQLMKKIDRHRRSMH